jgi:RND family efflux transporter MFP subunit
MNQNLEKLRITRSEPTTAFARKRFGRWFWLAAALAVVVAAWWLLPKSHEVETSTAGLVYPSRALTLVNATGYVVADRKAAVAAKITSRLVWLGVEEGSRVTKDQVLARLEGEDAAAGVRQAESDLAAARFTVDQNWAELADAKLNHERYLELVKRGVVARADYDAALARLRKAVAAHENSIRLVASRQAALELAQANLEYTVIRAPFDAVVLTKSADVGDIVTPIGASTTSKASVVSLADLASQQIEADVSESNVSKVHQDQPVEITLDAFGEERFQGHVHMIVPTADKTKATVMVKVRFDPLDPRILPQMSAKVAFLERSLTAEERVPRLAVPAKALTEAGTGQAVFVLKDGLAVLTPVAAGQAIGDMIEITRGVSAGDRVVLSPPPGLKDGDKVTTAGAGTGK